MEFKSISTTRKIPPINHISATHTLTHRHAHTQTNAQWLSVKKEKLYNISNLKNINKGWDKLVDTLWEREREKKEESNKPLWPLVVFWLVNTGCSNKKTKQDMWGK